MDHAPVREFTLGSDTAAHGWAGVWAGFSSLAVGGALSLGAWSEVHPVSPAFVSAIGAIVAVSYLATALLLSNRLVVSRSPGLALLASAYLLCGLAAGAFTLTFPGVATQWFSGGPEVSRWFWVVWHLAAALGIIGFVALDDEWAHRQARNGLHETAHDLATRLSLRDTGAFMRGPIFLAVTGVMAAAVWLWRDPAPFHAWFGGATLTPPFIAMLLLLDVAAVALLAVALRRDSIVRAWLMLAALASLLDVAAFAWSGGSSTIGWYFSQACGLAAALVLPIVLLGDLRSRLGAVEDRRPVLDASLIDPQTGLANLGGLAVQLGEIGRVAARDGKRLMIVVVRTRDDVPGPRAIRKLFRASDVIGRIGDDEYGVILTPGSDAGLGWLRRRRSANMTLQIGLADCDPKGPRPVGDLLDETLRKARANLADL